MDMDEPVKVRITATPREHELDGISLDYMSPGTVREVSSSIGMWLITQGYAEPEMRHARRDEDRALRGFTELRQMAADRRRRRSTDR